MRFLTMLGHNEILSDEFPSAYFNSQFELSGQMYIIWGIRYVGNHIVFCMDSRPLPRNSFGVKEKPVFPFKDERKYLKGTPLSNFQEFN